MSAQVQAEDHVIASRKPFGSEVLSMPMHHARVIAITSADRYGKRFITLEYREQLAGYPRMDTIKFVPQGRKQAATVIKQAPATVVAETAAAASAVSSSQSSSASQVSSSQDSTQVHNCVGHSRRCIGHSRRCW